MRTAHRCHPSPVLIMHATLIPGTNWYAQILTGPSIRANGTAPGKRQHYG